MSVNLQLLGIQAIPRLTKKLSVQVEFPRWSKFFGISPIDFQKILSEAGRIVKQFFEDFKVSWWDIYLNSDIGIERAALAKEMKLREDDIVLDVGCGRGYFTIAAAKNVKFVVGLDLMNGYGRQGWWKNFKTTMQELNLLKNVQGMRSDAQQLPFEEGSFTVVAAVHSIRNFPNKQSIERAISEMKRVVVEGGSVIIVENLPVARTKAQEAHLKMFKCKVKYSSGELYYFSKRELLEMFRKTGFRNDDVEIKILDYNLSATPPLFSLNASLLSEEKREYNEAVEMIRKWGEASPPTILIKATKHTHK
ncbi:MAG: class I SAM-dependent methyltransferase [Candidatus Baldrarchaeia archaeon]